MRIAVFGTGGVGGYFGGRLAQSGEDVTFIARGAHLAALQSDGLRVESSEGDFSIQPVQATDNPAEVGPVDAVLVATKAWQVTAAAEAMRPMVGPETMVVPLQNGVDAPGQLSAVLGAERVLGGLCRISSFVAAPGLIRHVAIDPYVAFGELDKRPSERAEKLRAAFERAPGIAVAIPDDIQVGMWLKFAAIAPWSGVGAITQAPIGVVRSLSETRQMLETVLQEVILVGRAHGVALPEHTAATIMNFLNSVDANAMASMQRDIMDGKPSELEAQPGAVVRLGQRAGIDTAVNAFIYHSLLPLEKRARGELDF